MSRGAYVCLGCDFTSESAVVAEKHEAKTAHIIVWKESGEDSRCTCDAIQGKMPDCPKHGPEATRTIPEDEL